MDLMSKSEFVNPDSIELTNIAQCKKKTTIHKVTTMLATPENVLFPGHTHLLTSGADDPSL